MASIEVDVDLNEFSFCELCDEVTERINRKFKRKDLEFFKKYKEEINDLIISLEHAGLKKEKDDVVENLRDELKMDFIKSIFDKYSQEDFEKMVSDFQKRKEVTSA